MPAIATATGAGRTGATGTAPLPKATGTATTAPNSTAAKTTGPAQATGNAAVNLQGSMEMVGLTGLGALLALFL